MDGPAPHGGYDFRAFDFEKILLDPLARGVFFPEQFSREAACRPGSNAGQAPLGIVPIYTCPFDWEEDRGPRHGSDLVIYELHVRGFTIHPNSGVPAAHRGTFQGAIDRISYLTDLGVTVVGLMPIFQFDPGEGNYWGYMPLNFCSASCLCDRARPLQSTR